MKAQISLHLCAGWSGPALSENYTSTLFCVLSFICTLHVLHLVCTSAVHISNLPYNLFIYFFFFEKRTSLLSMSKSYWKKKLGCTMQKCVFWHMQIATIQICLQICAVGSGSSLPAKTHWTLQNVSMESKCPAETLRMCGMNLNLCILHVWRHLFSWPSPFNEMFSFLSMLLYLIGSLQESF